MYLLVIMQAGKMIWVFDNNKDKKDALSLCFLNASCNMEEVI